ALILTEGCIKFDRLKHFGGSDKNGACAQYEEHFPDVAGILDHILLPTLHGTQAKRVGDHKDL
ncbi:hypothetical protein, partial [Sphingorhabdus sp.]|uniref:hypothetical protein n=1 Tax=Sphingorhabdus sp. TaxID=1902408 RepID=UPI0037C5CA93